jgi:hypothetical protein
VKQFLVGASHKLHLLLEPAIEALESIATDKSLLEKAHDSIQKANLLLCPPMLAGGTSIVIPGDEIPTSSTGELMYKLILSEDGFLGEMVASEEKAREAMSEFLF